MHQRNQSQASSQSHQTQNCKPNDIQSNKDNYDEDDEQGNKAIQPPTFCQSQSAMHQGNQSLKGVQKKT